MLPQLVEDLVHLERGQDRLDEDGRPDGAPWDAQRFLRLEEDVVPQPGLEVALHLRQVEVGAGAVVERDLRARGHVQAEVEEASADRLAVDQDVPLGQVPAAGADHQGGDLVPEGVALPLRRGEVDLPKQGVAEIELAADEVVERRRVAVLEVGHEDTGAGVEGVDDHLPVGGAGDLHAPVGQTGRDGGDPPVAVPDLLRGRQEVRQGAGFELLVTAAPRRQQLGATGAEAAVQPGQEGECILREHLRVRLAPGAAHLDAGDLGGAGHAISSFGGCLVTSDRPAAAATHQSGRRSPPCHRSGITGSRRWDWRSGPVWTVTFPPNTAAGRSRGSSCLKGPTPFHTPPSFSPVSLMSPG